MGFFECWLHADGKTWQDTDYDGNRDIPGDGQLQKANLVVTIPEDLKAAYENVTYKAIPFASNMPLNEMIALFQRGGGYYTGQVNPNEATVICDDYDKFYEFVLKYRPDEYKLQDGTNTTTFYIPDNINRTIDVKKSWQGDLVQGRRSLLPALVEFYGVKKEEKFVVPEIPPVPGCQNAPSVEYSWPVVYSWVVEHSSSYTDPVTGEIIDDSWTETVYETVEYTERLTADLTVNTKQGIAASTWESRGSWEIIPWAKARGLDPNEVTRAGYGIEVKVVTTYWTDYETKVPGPASAHGGSFGGPTVVQASFYNTAGQHVQTINLVPTSGSAGGKNITWELPQTIHTYPDGTRVTQRKHFTSETNKDGIYHVQVKITGAGHDLCLSRTKNVTIYGSMYDDSITRIKK